MSLDQDQHHGVKTKNSRKPHLTKDQRSPKLFRDVARILREVKSRKSSIKTALYSANTRRRVFNKVYALTFSVFKHLKVIDKVIEDVELLKNEPRLNLELAEVLVHEVCVMKRHLTGASIPLLIIQKYKKDIEKSFSKHLSAASVEHDSETIENSVPRYARVNTLVTNTEEVISTLKKKQFYEIVYNEGITLDEYHDMVKQLQSYEFLVDFHFKDLLVFQRHQNLCHLKLYNDGHIFLQDKSSCIPVHALSPPPGSVVFDTCAAPGMKTVHIAACMNNSGKIFATDRDEKRFEMLKEMLKLGGVEICKTSCCNFTDIDPNDEQFASVEYILVDPSCSGSGMVSRMDRVTDDEHSKSEDRLLKLAGFQVTLLKHALSFPSAKRVVYSTCSFSETENEYVIHEALNHYQHLYQIVPAFPDWPTRGQGQYEFSSLCLRSFPESNLTNGFFVAVFERLQDVPSNLKKRSKRNEINLNSEDMYDQNHANCSGNDEKIYVNDHVSLKNKRPRVVYKIEDSSNHAIDKNITKSGLRVPQSSEISYENDLLYGAEDYADVNSYQTHHVKQEVGEKTESTTVKRHKKKKHKDVEQNNVNYNLQETVNCPYELDNVKEDVEQMETVIAKKHKKKKHKEVEQKSTNCDLQEIVDNLETTIVKKHKKKKHKRVEQNNAKYNLKETVNSSDRPDNVEEQTKTTTIKKHKKKKHKDIEQNSSSYNLQETEMSFGGSCNVKDDVETQTECTIAKRHKSKCKV